MKHPSKPMRYTKLPEVKPVNLPAIVEEIYQGLGVEGIPLDNPTPAKRQSTSAYASPSPKRSRMASPAVQPPIPPLKIKLEHKEKPAPPMPLPPRDTSSNEGGNTSQYGMIYLRPMEYSLRSLLLQPFSSKESRSTFPCMLTPTACTAASTATTAPSTRST
jgi:hypothetical protein